MLKAVIKNNDNENILLIDIPYNRKEIAQQLAGIGLWIPAGNIYLKDNENETVSVKLISDDSFGDNLLPLFTEEYTLSTVNTMCDIISNLPDGRIKELNNEILKGKYVNARELMVDVINKSIADKKVITHTFKLYCPLLVKQEDEYGSGYEECDNYYVAVNEDKIRNALITLMVNDELNDMVEYFNGSESISNKLITAQWNVENVNGVLYGCILTGVTNPLTEEEMSEWKDFVLGQNSDGLGEIFEQIPVKTDVGDLYISFWNDSSDYFIYEKDEFLEYLNKGMEDLSL